MFEKLSLLVFIEGIQMRYEAWELIRLFCSTSENDNQESILFLEGPSLPHIERETGLLTLQVQENEGAWISEACLYHPISDMPQLEAALSGGMAPIQKEVIAITPEEMSQPGKKLLSSRKILCGTAIYQVLSRFTGKKLPYGSLTGVRPAKLATMCLEDGLNREETESLLISTTAMMPHKAHLLTDVALTERKYLDAADPVNIYVGIPFCASRCLYCSFTAYPIQKYQKLVDAYLSALEQELEAGVQMLSGMNRNVSSIYIGGGTPTALDAASLERLLHKMQQCFGSASYNEYTVEAGRPDTLDEEKLEIIRRYGATRISINPQTMNQQTLNLIGRRHTPEDIEDKYRMAREIGFTNINMDIIAGLPGEDLKMFAHTLKRLEAMSPDSLTVHTMAVKRASRLKDEKGQFRPTEDAVVDQMIEQARESAYRMGMKPYYLYRQKNIAANLENTGYAKPGLECLYNMQTMEETQSIMAFGAGAVSKLVIPIQNRIERAFNVKELTQYMDRIQELIERKKALFT